MITIPPTNPVSKQELSKQTYSFSNSDPLISCDNIGHMKAKLATMRNLVLDAPIFS